MMKHTLTAMLLTISALQATAQYRYYGLSGTNAQGSLLGGSNSLIFGTATSAAVNNVIIGESTANANTTGNGNVFIGQGVATSNTTGYANTFLGTWTGGANVSGYANTFLGQWCGVNTTGAHNSFVGQGSGNSNTTGGNNTFMGTGAGIGNTTGGGNSALGASAGFSFGNLTNSTVIGQNARCSLSNSLILGPDGTNSTTRLNVGIGTYWPGAHLHTVTDGAENVIFSTTSNFNAATLKMQAGSNYSNLFLNGNSMAGTYLPAVGAAAAIPSASMSGLVSQTGEAVTVGVDGYETNGAIHFTNMVANNVGSKSRTECMRIDNTTGFVGVHTRQTGNGKPQTIFHVNLTNPVNSSLNPLTQGIRFEGLPTATSAHTATVVIDANGNLAKGSGTGTEIDPLSWHRLGNIIVPGEFIGTLNNLDFVIQTNSTQRARVTNDGNLDFGGNTTTAGTGTSSAFGTGNTLDVTTSALASGTANNIKNSNYAAAIGDGNLVAMSSTSSVATGRGNRITNSANSMATGDQNTIDGSSASMNGGTGNDMTACNEVLLFGDGSIAGASYASGAIGEDNELYNGHGCFIGGGHNFSDGVYNFVGGNNTQLITHHNFNGGNFNYSDADFSIGMGSFLRAETSATPMPTTPFSAASIMLIGEQIHSDLNKSLSIGFTGNKTSVTTARGMAVQLDPNNSNTYAPTVNFEVDCYDPSLGASPGPMAPPATPHSNIRFHNLPPEPNGNALPAVLVDPTTGELFMSQMSYLKPGREGSDSNLDSLYNENRALRDRISVLESQLAGIDERFAQLERSINQVCENGCAGLKGMGRDVLHQSVPNPGDTKVTIGYHLARTYTSAVITLYGMDGKEVRSYSVLPGEGDGAIEVALSDLSSGVYLYRLVVDGRSVDAKKLQKQ